MAYHPGYAPVRQECVAADRFIRDAWPAHAARLDGREDPPPAAQPAPQDATGTPNDSAPPKKRARGQNKGRTFAKTGDEVPLCTQFAQGSCRWGDKCVPADLVPLRPRPRCVSHT